MLTLKIKPPKKRKRFLESIKNHIANGGSMTYEVDETALLQIQLMIAKGEIDHTKVVLKVDDYSEIKFDKTAAPDCSIPMRYNLDLARELCSIRFK